MAYVNFKDLTRRTVSDKILHDEAFTVAKNLKYDRYQREYISDQQSAEELHKPIIRNFKKRKVHLSFIDNIFGADLADMQLRSKFNKEFRFLLCIIDIYSKYAQAIPLKDKKGITITNIFQKILDKLKRKPNKI